MSEFADMVSQLTPVRGADADGAAARAILWRVDQGLLTRAEARTVLAALGLIPSKDGGTYRSTGQRVGPKPERDPNTKRFRPAKPREGAG